MFLTPRLTPEHLRQNIDLLFTEKRSTLREESLGLWDFYTVLKRHLCVIHWDFSKAVTYLTFTYSLV